jgi:hypothetical protein
MLGFLTSSDHQLYRVTPLKMPFRLLIGLLQSQSHVTTFTYNYFLRRVTFTQLIIIHVRDYNHLIHSYTGWLLSSQLLSQIITHFTFSHFPCLSPIETSLTHSWKRLLKTDCLDISVPLINPQLYKCHCSNEQGESCAASGHCVYTALPQKQACCRVTSSRPVAQEPYSNVVSWRHRCCEEKTPPPLLPRSSYSVARRLAVGYLATLCCATQRWVDMSQYVVISRLRRKLFFFKEIKII